MVNLIKTRKNNSSRDLDKMIDPKIIQRTVNNHFNTSSSKIIKHDKECSSKQEHWLKILPGSRLTFLIVENLSRNGVYRNHAFY